MRDFVEVNEAVKLTGKSVRTLYRLVSSLKRKEGKDLQSIKQERNGSKVTTYISLQALKEAYGLKYEPEGEQEKEANPSETGFYKALIQEKDRHISYLEKEIVVKNQQINSFQNQVENYQVIIQSKIPQLSEPSANKSTTIQGADYSEVENTTEQVNTGDSKPVTKAKGRRNRLILLSVTIVVAGLIFGIAYAYTQGYIKF